MLLYLILSILLVASSTGKDVDCPNHFISITGKCYRFYQWTSTWQGATGVCEGEGATLASVETDQERVDILHHINLNYGGEYWLSGALIDRNWVWTNDGSAMNRAWFGTTPVNSGNFCAYFSSYTRKYWDGGCTLQKKFICQKIVLPVPVPILNQNQNTGSGYVQADDPNQQITQKIIVTTTTTPKIFRPKCSTDFYPIAGKCYRFYQWTSSWSAAQGTCKGDGATMASVKTKQQYTDLLSHINANYGGQYWISGSLVNGNWNWNDGSAMNSAWFGGSPARSGNYCAYFCSFTHRYWSGSCNGQKKFICQKDEYTK